MKQNEVLERLNVRSTRSRGSTAAQVPVRGWLQITYLLYWFVFKTSLEQEKYWFFTLYIVPFPYSFFSTQYPGAKI